MTPQKAIWLREKRAEEILNNDDYRIAALDGNQFRVGHPDEETGEILDYMVDLEASTCTCPDWRSKERRALHGGECKHVKAVKKLIERFDAMFEERDDEHDWRGGTEGDSERDGADPGRGGSGTEGGREATRSARSESCPFESTLRPLQEFNFSVECYASRHTVWQFLWDTLGKRALEITLSQPYGRESVFLMSSRLTPQEVHALRTILGVEVRS